MPTSASIDPADVSRVFGEREVQEIASRAGTFARGGGVTWLGLRSWWQGELRWARNRVSLASDRRNVTVMVSRGVAEGFIGGVVTNQVDDVSLEAAVRAAERINERHGGHAGYRYGYIPPYPTYEPVPTAIWSDATYGLTTEARSRVARAVIDAAESEGMTSSGYVEVRGASFASLGIDNPVLYRPYTRWTQAQCSITVRDAKGRGSGWAALSSYDWSRVDPASLSQRAIEKCRASRNPVALEPGRYVVILEPQAVADLMEMVVTTFDNRGEPESSPSGHVWGLTYDQALGVGRSKLGLKVVDERITLSHDPSDPVLGIVMPYAEYPKRVTWIDKGVLTDLGHAWETDIRVLGGNHQLRGAAGYRMSGGDTSVEEMIRGTRRGLLVSRFSNMRLLDRVSRLSTGLTRDGLWLIENGRITKAVKNMRFTESPLFALNSIEQLGEPVAVFRPTVREGAELTPAVVPPLKVRDFSFTSAIDAI